MSTKEPLEFRNLDHDVTHLQVLVDIWRDRLPRGLTAEMDRRLVSIVRSVKHLRNLRKLGPSPDE